MRRHVVFVLVFLTASAVPSFAGAWEYEFGGRVGGVAPAGDLDASAYAWGFFASREVADNFSLQLGYLRHVHDMGKGPNDFVSRAKADIETFYNLTDSIAEVNDITLSGKYSFKGKRWVPFISGGVGVYAWNLTVTGTESISETSTTVTSPQDPNEHDVTETRESVVLLERETTDYYADFGVNLGGGVAYKLSKQLALGGEINYTHVFGDFDEGYFNILVTLSSGF
jgi:opacity protein-like surface antigen